MAGNRDDELARTATAQPSSTSPATPVEPVGPTLGRYTLERELGTGGMGVVHAAFDPDLERRIALKVLRTGGGSGDAEKRLLREARAMARLVHPNVVTVHEVGSVNGRDFVAMELIDGDTLAEWMRSRRRTEGEVIDAFVAAGRGLAAAHAAGIVHRDFKPHNVLRSRGGRIVVTDFGLAREAQAPDVRASVPTLPHAVAHAVDTTRSTPLAGITMTGSLLGTPAYMAPEQWSGGAVTPATDQFAFCVALWEALAGERPFRGLTFESLRDEVELGPAALDASKIPRRLRRALRRGLDPSPARRWPSMDALLGAMTRAGRRPAVALAITGGALVAAAVVYAAGRSSMTDVPPACQAPVLDPAAVWSDAARGKLEAGKRGVEARAIAADFARWQRSRDRACAVSPALREPQIACLDGVLARLDAVARGVEAMAPAVPPVDAGAYLIDPAICEVARPPRLAPVASPQFREVLATTMREVAIPGPFDAKAAVALANRVASEPCAAAWARLLVADTARVSAERDQQLAEAEQDAGRCGDDRVAAEVATMAAQFALGGVYLGAAVSTKVKLAELAVERVAQRDVTAMLDALRMKIATRAGNVDEAIARGEAAMAGYAARDRVDAQLAVGLRTLALRDMRAHPDDLAAAPKLCGAWRALAVDRLGADHPIVRRIDAEIATRMFRQGDVDGAYAKLERLRQAIPSDRPRRITGRVVDQAGAAVAGATVVAGPSLIGSSTSVAVAFPEQAGAMRLATTNAAGEFEIPDGPDDGVVIAQLADRRSPPAWVADQVALVLEPTSRIEGQVDLRGEPPTRVLLSIDDLRLPLNTAYWLFAPVGPDGTFAVDGAPRGKVRVMAMLRDPSAGSFASVTIDVRAPVVRDVKVAVASSKRVVHVVVRSTAGIAVGNAQVFAFPGRRSSRRLAGMRTELNAGNILFARQIEGEHAPAPVVAVARPGDVFATMPDVPEGVASACAIGLPGDMSDRDLQKKVNDNLAKIELRCVPIPPGAEVVTVEVPPWPRID